MTRLFTFGCSFTQYWAWPTWADCLGPQFDLFENWGICGLGNSGILYNLIECNQRKKLGPADTVLIMWTNTSREDRYVHDHWLQGGNVYWSAGSTLPAEYVANFACERGYLIRDLANISAAQQLLDAWGCNYKFMSIVPFAESNEVVGLGNNPRSRLTSVADALDLYRATIDNILPSVYESVFNKDWLSRPGIPDPNLPNNRRNFHPTPDEHILYLNRVLPEYTIDQNTIDWAHNITQRMMNRELVEWTEPNRPRRL